jgi:hypothetical protein
MRFWLDGVPYADYDNWIFWGSESAPASWSSIYVGNYGYGKQRWNVYFDDIYIDNTWARVEIGNASTYSACTKREIQPAVRWSDSSIDITLNQGSFSTLNGLFLFVVDSNGNASSGVPLKAGNVTQ